MSDVHVYIYDLSKGLASQLSILFIGKHLEGIWHTSIVCHEREWFFGSNGVEDCLPKSTLLGEPNRIVHLGRTEFSKNELSNIIQQLKYGQYRLGTYDLFHHNCNNFSNELAQYLVGTSIPSYILDLPKEVLNTPFGGMIAQMMRPPVITERDISSNSVETEELNRVEKMINEPIRFRVEFVKDFEQIKNDTQLGLTKEELCLIDEIKSYFEQTQIQWTIGTQHIKLLYKLLEIDHNHHGLLLNLLQLISLDDMICKLLKYDDTLIKKILPKLKVLTNDKLLEDHLKWFSNMCIHYEINQWFIQHQDTILTHVVDFITHDNPLVNKSCLAFCHNLICLFSRNHSLIDEQSGLALGCALVHIIQNDKLSNDESLVNVLNLFFICCMKSNDFKEYFKSLDDVNLSRYSSNEKTKELVDKIKLELEKF